MLGLLVLPNQAGVTGTKAQTLETFLNVKKKKTCLYRNLHYMFLHSVYV